MATNSMTGISHDNMANMSMATNSMTGISHDSVAKIPMATNSMTGISHDSVAKNPMATNSMTGISHDSVAKIPMATNSMTGISHDSVANMSMATNSMTGISHDSVAKIPMATNSMTGISHESVAKIPMATNSMTGISHDSVAKIPMATNSLAGISHDSVANMSMATNSMTGISHDSVAKMPMATNSMTGIAHDIVVNMPMTDSSMTNGPISTISKTAILNSNLENEEGEYINSGFQHENVDEPIVQPRKSSKHARFRCGMCIKYFCKKSQLKTHMSRCHDGTENNLCTMCGWFNTEDVDISAHMKSVHPWYKQCDQCEKWFSSKGRLNVHMVQVHTPATDRIQCHFCSSSFIRQKTLATHMHKFHMLLQCLECEEYFTDDEGLDVHQRKCHSTAGLTRRPCNATQNQVNECLVTSTSQDNDDFGQDIGSSPKSLPETSSMMDESVKSHDAEKVISDRGDHDNTESNTVSCKDIPSIQELTSLRDRHLEVSLCLQDQVDKNENHSMDNMKSSKLEINQSGLHCQSSKLNQAKDMISCKYCDLKLSCRASFSNHMILIHEACECENCNGWFENEKILLDHSRTCKEIKIRYGNSVKHCNLNDCNSGSPMCEAQQTTFEEHTEECLAPVTSFICSVCDMTFTKVESLVDHEKSCLKATSLKRHLTATHSDSEVEEQVIKLPKRKYMHRCCICRRVFSQHSHLKMHLQLHVKQKQPKRGGRVTGRVVTDCRNNFGVSYSCTDEGLNIPVESDTANCGKSKTVREELFRSFSTCSQMQGDKVDTAVSMKGSGGCDGGGVLKDDDMTTNAFTQCHEGGTQKMENVDCENTTRQKTETQLTGRHLMGIDTNSVGLENSLNNSHCGNLRLKMNTKNTMGNVNRIYVRNPLDVDMVQKVNGTGTDSAVDVNSIIASLDESLPVDQCPDMETSSAVQSLLEIPIIEQSHHVHSSERINCNHRQTQGFKDNSGVCQQSETVTLEQLCEDNHVSRDHSYMKTRRPSDVLSEYPSDLNTTDPSDVISENPDDNISTDPCNFKTAGQSNNPIIMASDDRNEPSLIANSRKEVKGSDKEENNSYVNSSNCSEEKDHSISIEDSSSTGNNNSFNRDDSCDADCSEENPSNSSSDKLRENHSFDSLQDGKDMEAEQELELPRVETSQSMLPDVAPSARGWKQVGKQSREANPCHRMTHATSKGCCSLSCAAPNGPHGRRDVHYMCGICQQIFKNFEVLQHHKVEQHSLRCSGCGLVCSRMIDLLTHYEFCDG